MYCVETFLEAGMSVRVHDPEAMASARKTLGDRVTYCEDSYEALQGASGLIVLTDWQQFRNPDLEHVARLLARPVIFDGRNLYDPPHVRRAHLEYHCVGRPAVC